jgi:hypothetical protein
MGPVQLRDKIFETLYKWDCADVIGVVEVEFELDDLYKQMVATIGLPREAIEAAILRDYPEWLRKNHPHIPPLPEE